MGAAFIEFVKEAVFAARYRLEVEPDNTRVKALYRRHGFSPLAYESYVLENREENGKKQ